MPRRSILSAAERESLLALPDTTDALIRHYTVQRNRPPHHPAAMRSGAAQPIAWASPLSSAIYGATVAVDEEPFPPLLRDAASRYRCLRLRGGLGPRGLIDDKRSQQAVIMSPIIIGEAVRR